MKLSYEVKRLELRVNWKISRNEALFKENIIIKLEECGLYSIGEVAPNVRYNESLEKVIQQIDSLPPFNSPQHLLDEVNSIQVCHSLKCALVCSAVDLVSKKRGLAVENFLNVFPIAEVATSMSVPIMQESLIEDYLSDLTHFKFIKIKVEESNCIELTRRVAKISKVPVRVDANEAFSSKDSFLTFTEAISDLNIEFIEQPFKSRDLELYREVKGQTPFEIMADESVEDYADFKTLVELFDSVNVKLMKAGGYLKAKELMEGAKANGMKVMLGCMIESSIGIRNALRLGSLADFYDLDGSLLLKNDPFHKIKESNGLVSIIED